MDSSESKEENNGEVPDGPGEGPVLTKLKEGRKDFSDKGVRDFVSSLQPLGEGKERSEFKEEILRDDSLKFWRELADSKERGFKWERWCISIVKVCVLGAVQGRSGGSQVI